MTMIIGSITGGASVVSWILDIPNYIIGSEQNIPARTIRTNIRLSGGKSTPVERQEMAPPIKWQFTIPTFAVYTTVNMEHNFSEWS